MPPIKWWVTGSLAALLAGLFLLSRDPLVSLGAFYWCAWCGYKARVLTDEWMAGRRRQGKPTI